MNGGGKGMRKTGGSVSLRYMQSEGTDLAAVFEESDHLKIKVK